MGKRAVTMGCASSTPNPEDDAAYFARYKGPTSAGEGFEGLGEYLEDAVREEWDSELDALFALWDLDKSGFLEVAEIGKIVALYEEEPWESWSVAQRNSYTVDFMKWYDQNSTPDNKLSKSELKIFIVTQACVDDPKDPDA